MMEDTGGGWLGMLGLKLGTLVAGFAGGVISLAYLKNLTRTQGALAVFTSIATAGYVTPVIVQRFSVTQVPYQYGAAFVVGLCAMNIIPAIKALGNATIARATAGAGQPTQGDGDSK